ncbi:MAG: alpha/beta hydrolase [Spirochaetaceae bacterium]|nr:MAG: alpha/beta hydrolase [Spirochaetaceae bacterium]
MGSRRLRWLLVSPFLVVLLLVLWGVMDSSSGASARTMWNDTWRNAEGVQLGGYLVTPVQARRVVSRPATGTPAPAIPSGDGRYPAVLLLHEWWGLNKDISYLSEQLAADGYVVLVPDLLRGRLSVTIPGALFQMLTTSADRIDRDLDRAFLRLRDVPEVDPDRIAVVGFCFGGTQAMRLGMRNEELYATAIFYGGNPISDRSEVGHLGARGPVLGVYGAKDRTISEDRVTAFEGALREAGVEHEFHIFPEEGHAFVTSSSIRRSRAAADAWDLLRGFLRRHL